MAGVTRATLSPPPQVISDCNARCPSSPLPPYPSIPGMPHALTHLHHAAPRSLAPRKCIAAAAPTAAVRNAQCTLLPQPAVQLSIEREDDDALARYISRFRLPTDKHTAYATNSADPSHARRVIVILALQRKAKGTNRRNSNRMTLRASNNSHMQIRKPNPTVYAEISIFCVPSIPKACIAKREKKSSFAYACFTRLRRFQPPTHT